MEYSTELLDDNRVKITISKKQKNVDLERIRKMIDKKMFGVCGGEELKTIIRVYYKIKNRQKAVIDCSGMFIVTYNLILKLEKLGFTNDAVVKLNKFMDEQVEKICEKLEAK